MLSDSDLQKLASIQQQMERDDPIFVQAFRYRRTSSDRRAVAAAALIISVILCVASVVRGVPVVPILFALTAWCAARKLDQEQDPDHQDYR